MRKSIFIIFMVVMLSLCSCINYKIVRKGDISYLNMCESISSKTQRGTISVEIPKNVKIKHNIIMDFEIYQFKYHDREILSAYLGNQPEIITDHEKYKTKEGIINDLKYKKYFIVTENGNSNDYLVELPENNWPVYIHFWYTNLSPEEERISLEIINSLKKQE